jgi:hypothetical protein
MYSVDSKISIGLKALFSKLKHLTRPTFLLGPLELQAVFLDIAHLCQQQLFRVIISPVKLV